MNIHKAILTLACTIVVVFFAGQAVQAAPPANNNCANAEAVGNVTNKYFSTVEATFDGPTVPTPCLYSPDIWYSYTATCDGEVTVSLNGSSYDTKMAVYDGVECPATIARIIDCNDVPGEGEDIFPGAIEVCDNAIYPVGSPFVGDPIDNNCSAVNGLYFGDSGRDDDDPDCCVDIDGDGFGVESAYLYKGNPPLCAASLLGYQERPPYDCMDVSNPITIAEGINPNVKEDTLEKCTDSLNNNCRISGNTGAERIDHIDI